MSTRVRIDQIVMDAGTQVRAAIDSQVVTDYAEAMSSGATFPPIVVFNDGAQHYLGDGFHRIRAAERIHWREIDADVRPGTKTEAIWFALGANRTNGKRLTEVDKRSAAILAVRTWPDKSAAIIADQIGCSHHLVSLVRSNMKTEVSSPVPSHVIGKDGKKYPSSPSVALGKRARAKEMLKDGAAATEVQRVTGIGRDTLNELRRDLGLSVDKTKAGVRQRRDQMRAMAADGHTSRQIAAKLGLNENSCRDMLRQQGIEVPADKVTRGTHRHDSNRIVERIVVDAENLTEGINLIEFGELHRDRLADWLRSLSDSRDKLGGFINRLRKEQQNGQAA